MKEIVLSRGEVAIVDDADYEYLNGICSWHLYVGPTGKKYARGTPRGFGGKHFFMHKFLLRPPAGLVTDHINNNGLDNRRENLRLATPSQNMANSDRPKHNTSGFKGVTFNMKKNRWRARIKVNGKLRDLGLYKSLPEAACAYSVAGKEIFGEYHRAG